MFMSAILSVLVGMVLGQRFKVFVLAPTFMLVLVLAAGLFVMGAGAPSTIVSIAMAAIISLQFGYLVGIAIHELLLMPHVSRRRLDHLESLSPPRAPQVD
jgi:hypothetical protein